MDIGVQKKKHPFPKPNTITRSLPGGRISVPALCSWVWHLEFVHVSREKSQRYIDRVFMIGNLKPVVRGVRLQSLNSGATRVLFAKIQGVQPLQHASFLFRVNCLEVMLVFMGFGSLVCCLAKNA